jgi:hypothetical protein
MRKLLVMIVAGLVAACNPMAQMNGADEQIEQFHDLYTAQDLDGLYAMTGQELRDVAPREQWDQLVALIDERLGAVQDSSQTGFNVNTDNGQTTTVITRDTTFELGQGTETFTFFGSGDDLRLVGWEVESERLLDSAAPAPAEGSPMVDPATEKPGV